MSDVHELRALSRDLGKASAVAAVVMYGVVKDSANDVRAMWYRNAKLEADKAARRYADTITVHPAIGTGIRFEVYPDARVNGQARLGDILENGSPTSPPHLWAERATQEAEPRIERKIDLAIGKMLGGSGL